MTFLIRANVALFLTTSKCLEKGTCTVWAIKDLQPWCNGYNDRENPKKDVAKKGAITTINAEWGQLMTICAICHWDISPPCHNSPTLSFQAEHAHGCTCKNSWLGWSRENLSLSICDNLEIIEKARAADVSIVTLLHITVTVFASFKYHYNSFRNCGQTITVYNATELFENVLF